MGGDSPEGVSSKSHRSDRVSQFWSPMQGRQASLAGWRTGGTNRKAVRSLDSAHEEAVHAGLPGFLQPTQQGPQHEPSKCSGHTHSTRQSSTGSGVATTRENSTMGRRGEPVPERSLGWWKQPLLAINQAAHLKQLNSLMVAAAPQLTS